MLLNKTWSAIYIYHVLYCLRCFHRRNSVTINWHGKTPDTFQKRWNRLCHLLHVNVLSSWGLLQWFPAIPDLKSVGAFWGCANYFVTSWCVSYRDLCWLDMAGWYPNWVPDYLTFSLRLTYPGCRNKKDQDGPGVCFYVSLRTQELQPQWPIYFGQNDQLCFWGSSGPNKITAPAFCGSKDVCNFPTSTVYEGCWYDSNVNHRLNWGIAATAVLKRQAVAA